MNCGARAGGCAVICSSGSGKSMNRTFRDWRIELLFVPPDFSSVPRLKAVASSTFTTAPSSSVVPTLSTSQPSSKTPDSMLIWTISLIVGSVLILVVPVLVCLWMFFRRKSWGKVLPSELLNHNIDMVSITRFESDLKEVQL
jgi:hypothetical protein